MLCLLLGTLSGGTGKGGSPDFSRSYVERPIEYERRVSGVGNERFEVLYDYFLNPDGTERGMRRCPADNDGDGQPDFYSPGTPRHPAYPSGHSTSSAAASRILEYFFAPPGSIHHGTQGILRDLQEEGNNPVSVELRRLADNIGVARL